ncbi:putative inactive purple acid phosphatase 1 [Diplonema papillatum]|nr:putative inactive purple acid phosphatase 1 [Diplonema papillatum]
MRTALLSLLMGAAAVQARHVHVAIGSVETELVVQWSTDSAEGVSEVRYGLSPSALNQTSIGDARAFTADKGRGVFYTRTAVMTGLMLGQVYYYQVGDPVNGYSQTFHVRNRKQTPPFRHVIYGDMGAAAAFTLCDACSQASPYCNATTCEKNTTAGLVSEVDVADMIVHVGDFAYNFNDDNGTTGEQFMQNIEQVAAYIPYMVSHGNHEDDEENLAYFVEHFRSQPTNSVPATFRTANGVSKNNLYFSWDFGLVHYISFSSELFHGIRSTEPDVTWATFLLWLEDDLQKANQNRDKAPWILAHAHRPLYSSAHIVSSDPLLRIALEPMFHKYGVDLSVNGHEHDYERSWPTYLERSQKNYSDAAATVYLVSGAAGSPELHDPFDGPQPGWSAFRSNTFGYSRMNVYNASHLHWQQVQTDPYDFPLADYGRVIDDVWIVQHNHGPFNASRAPTEVLPEDSGVTYDHFAPLLKDLEDGSGRPLHVLIQKYVRENGEKAWAHRLAKLLDSFNRRPSSHPVEWEDGLLSDNVTAAIKKFQWIDAHSQSQ